MIHAGPLLKEFLSNTNKPETKKAYFYSGHDLNIALIVETLQVGNFDFPDFGCALIMETWQDMLNKHIKFVKVYRRANALRISLSKYSIISAFWLAWE